MTSTARRRGPAPHHVESETWADPSRLLSPAFTNEATAKIRAAVDEFGAGVDYGTGHVLDRTVRAELRRWLAGADRDYQDRQEATQREVDLAKARVAPLETALEADKTEIADATAALDEARARIRSLAPRRKRLREEER